MGTSPSIAYQVDWIRFLNDCFTILTYGRLGSNHGRVAFDVATAFARGAGLGIRDIGSECFDSILSGI